MTNERRQNWSIAKHEGATPWINVTLELVTADVETDETLDTEPWRAVYEIGADRGHAVISGVRLVPADPAKPARLPARLARELLKPGLALEAGRVGLIDMVEDPEVSDRERRVRTELLARWHGLDAARLGTERRGKRQPDYFYAVIAALYVDAHTAGSIRPVADVADQLLKPYKAPFVRDALSKARDRGLLERSAGQRQAGGDLTSQGRQVLASGPPEGYIDPQSPARP